MSNEYGPNPNGFVSGRDVAQQRLKSRGNHGKITGKSRENIREYRGNTRVWCRDVSVQRLYAHTPHKKNIQLIQIELIGCSKKKFIKPSISIP